MKKNQKDTGLYIFLVFLVAIVAGAFLLRYLSNRTATSTPGIYGNTAGNLYNQGLYCDDGKKIYFSNMNDQGMLYSMSYDLDDFKLMYEDTARYINADEHYVYYSRMNSLKPKEEQSVFRLFLNGIFRISKKGKNLKMIWNEPIGSLLYYDNQLYYQYYSEGKKLSIHRISIDGETDRQLFSEDTVAVSLYNGRLYYGGKLKDRDLHSGSITDGSTRVDIEGGFYNPIVNADGVYYIDVFDKYKLKRCNHDGSNVKTFVRHDCSAYNFSRDGRTLFYQVDDGDDSGMFMMNLDTEEVTMIKQGNFKWINTVNDCCFFSNSDGTVTYVYRNGKGLSMFDPPVLSK